MIIDFDRINLERGKVCKFTVLLKFMTEFERIILNDNVTNVESGTRCLTYPINIRKASIKLKHLKKICQKSISPANAKFTEPMKTT